MELLEPLDVPLMSHPLLGLTPGPVSSTNPLPATSEGFEEALPEVFASAAGPSEPMTVRPASLPDAKSTFGNEHE
jgi:hypothetical protein